MHLDRHDRRKWRGIKNVLLFYIGFRGFFFDFCFFTAFLSLFPWISTSDISKFRNLSLCMY